MLDEDVAGVFGDFHADVTGFNGARLQMEMRGAQQDGRRPAIAQHQAFERGVIAGNVKHGCIGKSLRVDLDARRFADDSHAVQIHERRQPRLERNALRLDQDVRLTGGCGDDEQRFPQCAGPKVIRAGDIHRQGTGGPAGRRLTGVVPPAQPGKNCEQEERACGKRNSLFRVHMRSRMKTACHERSTALRPNSTSIGIDNAVTTASAAVRSCCGSRGR